MKGPDMRKECMLRPACARGECCMQVLVVAVHVSAG